MSVTERKTRMRGPLRRERIVGAARELFSERAYDAVSMADVAGRAGVSRPVLYDHFASKKDLVLHLLTEETSALIENIGSALTLPGQPRERLANALDAFFGFVVERPVASRLFSLESASEPDIVEASQKMRDLAYAGIAELVGRRGTTGRDVAVVGLVSSVIGIANWWRANPDVPKDEILTTTIELMWSGFARKGGSA